MTESRKHARRLYKFCPFCGKRATISVLDHDQMCFLRKLYTLPGDNPLSEEDLITLYNTRPIEDVFEKVRMHAIQAIISFKFHKDYGSPIDSFKIDLAEKELDLFWRLLKPHGRSNNDDVQHELTL